MPPRIESSSDAANRRRSERAMPGAPMQTWYCSVSLRWKRSPGGGGRDERTAHADALRRCVAGAALRALDEPHERVVVEVPGRGEHDVAADVHRAVVGGERAPADRRDHVARADHRPAERVVAEHRFREEVVHELLRRVLVHRDLLEHDLALGVELGERRREDHVRHHVERGLEMRVGNARVDDGVLARGRRVQLAAEPVEDLRDLLRACSDDAPLKRRCSRKCETPGALLFLVARAGADPVAERDGADARHALGDHALAGIELGDLVLPHRRIVGDAPLVPPCAEAYGRTRKPAASIRRATGSSARSTSLAAEALEARQIARDVAERALPVERGEHAARSTVEPGGEAEPVLQREAELGDVHRRRRRRRAARAGRARRARAARRGARDRRRRPPGSPGRRRRGGCGRSQGRAGPPEARRQHPVRARAPAQDHGADGDPLDPEPLEVRSQRSIAAA